MGNVIYEILLHYYTYSYSTLTKQVEIFVVYSNACSVCVHIQKVKCRLLQSASCFGGVAFISKSLGANVCGQCVEWT